jgi:predicted tellurium resistance membrane protein TerC
MLAGAMHRFIYLKHGLAMVLLFVGVKMLTSELFELRIAVSLGIIAAVLALSIGFSLFATRNAEPERLGQIGHQD